MITFIKKKRSTLTYRAFSAFTAFTFIFSMVVPPRMGYAQFAPVTVLNLPAPGTMLPISQGYTPAMVIGVTVHPENPLAFDFILDKGDSGLAGTYLEEESKKLIKYFLATLTVPEDELWVNLSPYEKDRIVPEVFGQTEMGRDLLAQDYLLKQLTASLMYPENDLGKKFWDRVYKKAYDLYETTEIPMNTFNKVWIVPEEATVYEHEGSAYVLRSHLKVMLEEDYVALKNNKDDARFGMNQLTGDKAEVISGVTSEVVREVLIPEIEKEINEGETFANLRQIYNSMILAAWYKKSFKESLLGQVYVDRNKVKGVDVDDKQAKQKIYDQYLEAFKKGVYNYIKEDYDPATHDVIPRKYFSGGTTGVKAKDVKELTLEDLPYMDKDTLIDFLLTKKNNMSQEEFKLVETRVKQLAAKDRETILKRLGITSSLEDQRVNIQTRLVENAEKDSAGITVIKPEGKAGSPVIDSFDEKQWTDYIEDIYTTPDQASRDAKLKVLEQSIGVSNNERTLDLANNVANGILNKLAQEEDMEGFGLSIAGKEAKRKENDLRRYVVGEIRGAALSRLNVLSAEKMSSSPATGTENKGQLREELRKVNAAIEEYETALKNAPADQKNGWQEILYTKRKEQIALTKRIGSSPMTIEQEKAEGKIVGNALHTVLDKGSQSAGIFLSGGYQQSGYGVAAGAVNDGSHAIGTEGDQGYYVDTTNIPNSRGGFKSGKQVFVDTVNDMKSFLAGRAKRNNKPIRVIIKTGIGGQHTPFQGIANVFEKLDSGRNRIIGEYELGKDYQAFLEKLVDEMGIGWDQIAVIPSSKSGSTDETMMVFVDIMKVLLQKTAATYIAQGAAINGEKFAGAFLDYLHNINFKDGKELPGGDLFKNFNLDDLVRRINQDVENGRVTSENVRQILGKVLGNMFFETTDRPKDSRLSAFIRNSGLDRLLGEDAPGFGAMFDNVGGRWTGDLHMMTFLAFHGLNAEDYWQARYNGIKEVRQSTHVANELGNVILDQKIQKIQKIALLVPDELYWFGQGIEQNFNESIWQKGYANLRTVTVSEWEHQRKSYTGNDALVINMTDLNVQGLPNIVKIEPVKMNNRQTLAKDLARAFTTFYGMTYTVGTRLIGRALEEGGYTAADVDVNDLNNPATKILQENLFLRQPYVELGKGLLSDFLQQLQGRQSAWERAGRQGISPINQWTKEVAELARNRDMQHSAREALVSGNLQELSETITAAVQYARGYGKTFVPFIYLEGDKYEELRQHLRQLGYEWILQGTGSQHISWQQVLANPNDFFPFVVSLVPEENDMLAGHPAIGFAKGYLDHVSPNVVRDLFAMFSYQAFKNRGGEGAFMRMVDTDVARAQLNEAFTQAASSPVIPEVPILSAEVLRSPQSIREGIEWAKKNKHIYGGGYGYDIRLRVNFLDSNDVLGAIKHAYALGRTLGAKYLKPGEQALDTGDQRLTSDPLRLAFAQGLVDEGKTVITQPDGEVVTTGLPSRKGLADNIALTNQITGSHNPTKLTSEEQFEANGFKISLKGEPIVEEKLTQLYEEVISQDGWSKQIVPGGRIIKQERMDEEHVEALDKVLPDLRNPPNLIVDFRGGAAGNVLMRLAERKGYKVIKLASADAELPAELFGPQNQPFMLVVNDKPSATMEYGIWNPENEDAYKEIKKLQARIYGNPDYKGGKFDGAAFDGDGDRVGVMTTDGRMVPPDRMLIAYYEHMLRKHAAAIQILVDHHSPINMALDVRSSEVILGILEKISSELGLPNIQGQWIKAGYPTHRAFVADEIRRILTDVLPSLNQAEQKAVTDLLLDYVSAEASGHFFFRVTSKEQFLKNPKLVDDGIPGLIHYLSIAESRNPENANINDVDGVYPTLPIIKANITNTPDAVEIKQVIAEAIVKRFAEQNPGLFPMPVAELIRTIDETHSQPPPRQQAREEALFVDGARVNLTNGVWFLVRKSNTSNYLSFLAEAKTKEDGPALVKTAALIRKAIEDVIQSNPAYAKISLATFDKQYNNLKNNVESNISSPVAEEFFQDDEDALPAAPASSPITREELEEKGFKIDSWISNWNEGDGRIISIKSRPHPQPGESQLVVKVQHRRGVKTYDADELAAGKIWGVNIKTTWVEIPLLQKGRKVVVDLRSIHGAAIIVTEPNVARPKEYITISEGLDGHFYYRTDPVISSETLKKISTGTTMYFKLIPAGFSYHLKEVTSSAEPDFEIHLDDNKFLTISLVTEWHDLSVRSMSNVVFALNQEEQEFTASDLPEEYRNMLPEATHMEAVGLKRFYDQGDLETYLRAFIRQRSSIKVIKLYLKGNDNPVIGVMNSFDGETVELSVGNTVDRIALKDIDFRRSNLGLMILGYSPVVKQAPGGKASAVEGSEVKPSSSPVIVKTEEKLKTAILDIAVEGIFSESTKAETTKRLKRRLEQEFDQFKQKGHLELTVRSNEVITNITITLARERKILFVTRNRDRVFPLGTKTSTESVEIQLEGEISKTLAASPVEDLTKVANEEERSLKKGLNAESVNDMIAKVKRVAEEIQDKRSPGKELGKIYQWLSVVEETLDSGVERLEEDGPIGLLKKFQLTPDMYGQDGFKIAVVDLAQSIELLERSLFGMNPANRRKFFSSLNEYIGNTYLIERELRKSSSPVEDTVKVISWIAGEIKSQELAPAEERVLRGGRFTTVFTAKDAAQWGMTPDQALTLLDKLGVGTVERIDWDQEIWRVSLPDKNVLIQKVQSQVAELENDRGTVVSAWNKAHGNQDAYSQRVQATRSEDMKRLDAKILTLQNMIDELKKSSSPAANDEIRATKEEVGGIDLNPALLNLQIKRDGEGVPLPLFQQPIHNMHIDGFLPVIIQITPISVSPLFLGLLQNTNEDEDMDLSLQYELGPMELRSSLKVREPQEEHYLMA